MFGIDLFDAALMPSLAVSLLAGLLSFLSPCVLPIVPPYLAYMGGISMGEMTGGGSARRRVMLPALFFVNSSASAALIAISPTSMSPLAGGVPAAVLYLWVILSDMMVRRYG